jgi:diadenosine tetraphosphatase ApaH/serine/threonine PP2A family protein phosphatase
MRDIFIGDVHGCLLELDQLLAIVQPHDNDRLFFLGDLVDRGPDSIGVVRRVRGLLNRFPGSVAIAGNHEEKALRYRERRRPLPAWALRARSDDWNFLDSLPLVHRVRESQVVMVHGGFYPAFFEAYGSVGDVGAQWRCERGRKAERMRRFLRVRRVGRDGEVLRMDDIAPEAMHWSDRYDGREGFCFYGHDPQIATRTARRSRHAMGLDTGCCFGGSLTAAVLERACPAATAVLISVDARQRYAEPRLASHE